MLASELVLTRVRPARDLARRVGLFSALLLIACALLIPRLASIGQSLWVDEVESVQKYISGGPAAIFGRYGTQDHMLFSFLGWLTVRLPGGPDWAYRLWGIIPFLVAVVLIAWWLQRKAGQLTAGLFLAFAAVNSFLLQLTGAARGYGLAFLMMAVLMVAACEIRSGKRWLILFFAAATLGAWTLPTFVLPASAATVVLLVTRFQWRLVVGAVTSTALIAGWYLPVAGFLSSSGQRYGSPLDWWSPLTGPFELLPISMFFPAGGQFGTVASVLLALLLAPLLILGVREARALIPGLAEVAGAAMVWPFVLLTAVRFFVVPRFFSYLLVPILVLVALGARRILCETSSARWVVARQCLGVVFAFAACVFVGVAWTFVAMPREAVREAAGAIKQADPAGNIPVLGDVHYPRTFSYYLPPTIRLQAVRSYGRICSPHPRGLIFVYQPYRPGKPNTSCLVRQGAVLQHFAQWSHGPLDVWVLPPR